jgi:peptidoglycan/LPS O-acetylase OafA/YrhL
MFGCLAALMYDQPIFRWVVSFAYRALLPGASALFVAFISPALARRFGGFYLLPFGGTLDALAITIVLLWCVEHPASWVGRLLNARPVVHLGVLSYSLYLWQQLFAHIRKPWALPAAVVTAELSYYRVERPFLRLRNRARRKTGRERSAAERAGA